MPLILSQAQAQAVYSAMCALNSVSAYGRASLTQPELTKDWITVSWDGADVQICKGILGNNERHETQTAFAEAYGLI